MRNKDLEVKNDINLVKVAADYVPRVKRQGPAHKQEPQLAVMYFRGELSTPQVDAALKAAGFVNPCVPIRMAKALQVALDTGLVKLVDAQKK